MMCPATVPIIIIDDEPMAVDPAAFALRMEGFANVTTSTCSRDFGGIARGLDCAIVLLDITMPTPDGLELLDVIAQEHPGFAAIMMTGINDVEVALKCVRSGAYDYLVKPVNTARLVTAVRKAHEHLLMRMEASRLGARLLERKLDNPDAFSSIVTMDPTMQGIFRYTEAIAPTDLPVLVTGETGTGKELIAQAVHRASGRPGEFVCINTAGIDDTLFSDTLFGHSAGAFTGAQRDRLGLIEKAANGTLFLDEIGDLSPASQVKLLRLLQEGTYYPLGSEIEKRSSARIVAATNRSIAELNAEKSFRRDLFFRLKAHSIKIPSLRDRRADIPLLVRTFVEEAAQTQGKRPPAIPQELFSLLNTHHFPGNIRELRGMIFDAVSRHTTGVLSSAPFKAAIGELRQSPCGNEAAPTADLSALTTLPTLEQMEVLLVREALRRCNDNRTIAAAMLGISRQTLRSKLHASDPDSEVGGGKDLSSTDR